MLPENTIYFIMVVQLLAASTYIYDTVRGKAKPNRVTWLLWGVFAILAFFSSRAEGAGNEAYFTLMVGINPLLIFIASFVNKQAYWKITKRDYQLGAAALFGTFLWAVTGEGLLALGFAIAADLLAGMPTLAKAYKAPETESPILFMVCIVNSILTLFIADELTAASLGFPVYVLSFCLAMTYLVVIRPRQLKRHG